MSHILALDQSTSATKAILFAEDGSIVDGSAIEHQQIYPQSGWVEHDAEEIWTNVLSAVRSLKDQNPAALESTTCLSITNQRETIVAFDRATGKPLANAIVWQCRRGDDICCKMRDDGHNALVHAKTGLRLDTYFSGPKMRWMVENMDGLAERLTDGSALIGTIDTYLIYRLTGGSIFATDSTNASRTLLFDIKRLAWDAELCNLFRIPPKALPEVRNSAAHFGDTTLCGLLKKNLPIHGVIGDSQASLFAQGCLSSGAAKVTLGTGSSLLLNIGAKPPEESGDALTSLAWVRERQPTYALEGIINYAGGTINWLRDQLRIIDSPAETEAMALSVEDNGGVYLVPAFVGLSAPYWNSSAKAGIIGMSAHSDRRHVARAALESIAYQIRDVLEDLHNGTGVELQSISADGGAIQNTFLMQFMADLLRIPVRSAEAPEYSALGAARFGALGLGRGKLADSVDKPPACGKTYLPQAEVNVVNRYYNEWKEAVRRVL
jgi:glycerol kinase